MFATQLVRSNNVLSLLVDPAKTLVTRQWLFDNGFKINNYKTVKGITTFVIRSYTASGFAKLTAKYPVNAPAPVVIATPEPTPAVVIDSTHPDHPDFSDAEDRAAEARWMEQREAKSPAATSVVENVPAPRDMFYGYGYSDFVGGTNYEGADY